MIDLLLRMLACTTLGLLLVLLLRRPARRMFGAGAAFMLWLLPVVLGLAPLLPQQLAPAAMVVLPGLTVTPHAAVVATPVAAIDWTAWLVALWLAGATVGLLRLVVNYIRLRRGVRTAPDAWASELASLARASDARRVRVHPSGPAVLWALPRSLVLLPEDLLVRFENAATRELVLRHELTHVRRGDVWWNLAMELASALLWFHPLAWLARARFLLDQELACDAAALRTAPQHTAGYARALLDSVAVQPEPALIPWLAEPQLKERIAMLARMPPGALRRRAGFVAVAAVLAGGLYVAGGQAPVQAATQALTRSTPPMVDMTWKNEHPPRYPVAAIQKNEQGTVVLDVAISAAGQVTGVRVDTDGTTAPALLQDSAVAAARGWRFRAGTKDGKPVAGVVRVPVNFSLGEMDSTTPGAPNVDISYKNRNPPRYPVDAIKHGQQGTVILDVTVTPAGKVAGVQVDQHGTNAAASLQLAAIEAAEQWKFNHGRKGGKPVGGVIQIPVNFSLNNTPANAQAAKPCPAGDLYDVASARCVSTQPNFIPPASAK